MQHSFQRVASYFRNLIKKEDNVSTCAVIMPGGSGTRLWPLSRSSHNRQFLSLHYRDYAYGRSSK